MAPCPVSAGFERFDSSLLAVMAMVSLVAVQVCLWLQCAAEHRLCQVLVAETLAARVQVPAVADLEDPTNRSSYLYFRPGFARQGTGSSRLRL